MEELINNCIVTYGLAAVFLLMTSNGFMSAPPSELILSLAGVLAATTNYSLIHTMCAAVAGNLAGTYILYIIGKKIGYKWLLKLKAKIEKRGRLVRGISKFIPEEKVILLLSKTFQEKGAIWVGIFRCLPMVRSIISLPAGIINMSHLKFFTYSISGIIVWAGLWQGLGCFIGENWKKVSAVVTIPLLIVVIAVIIYLKIYTQKYIEKNLENETS